MLAASRPDSIRILHSADGLVVAGVGAVCVAVWRSATNHKRFEHQRAGLAEIVRQHPEGAAFLCVVEKTSLPPPNEELRKASSEMVASHGARLKGVACVIEAAGFSAALIRGVLTGMTFLLPSSVAPQSFFSNTRDAAEWLSRYVSLGPLDTFMIKLQTIRSQLSLPPGRP